MNIRNSECGTTVLAPSSVEPHSFREMKPPGSKRGFSLSNTLGLQRLASRRTTHEPSRMHLVSVPSTHSNLPAARAPRARSRSPRRWSASRSAASILPLPSDNPPIISENRSRLSAIVATAVRARCCTVA